MITISKIKDSLNPKFIIQNGIMEEKKQSMKIDIKYKDDYVLFKSDAKRTTVNDCFNPTINTLNRKADYIIFTVKNETIHIVVAELKVSNNPIEQLDLTKYFAEYIISRIKYKHKSLRTNVVIRKLGIFKDKVPQMYKNTTKAGNIYNKDNIGFIAKPTLYLANYL